jgi:DNA topoisomerase-2
VNKALTHVKSFFTIPEYE